MITAWLLSSFEDSYHSISVIKIKTNFLCPFYTSWPLLVVTFSLWVNYSLLIVTLSWPVWLFRIQQDHFGFHIPRGFASVIICFELSIGLEPTTCWLQISCTTNCATKANMYQFHTNLLGTIRVSRTRCTTQLAIICSQLLGFHHKELVNGVRTHLIECMPTSTFTAHLIHCTPYGTRTHKLSRERGVS